MKKPYRDTYKQLTVATLVVLLTSIGHAQSAKGSATTTAPDDQVFQLSPFEVNTTKDTGYQATETLAGTRIRTNLGDVASAVSVVTKEFMQDIGATDNSTLLQYTANAEVAGTHGTYSGLGNTQTLFEGTPISANQRLRGLGAADNTRDYFLTDIPWDSYNVDRIDIQRGPNSILFGLGAPAGIIIESFESTEPRIDIGMSGHGIEVSGVQAVLKRFPAVSSKISGGGNCPLNRHPRQR